MSEHRGWAGWLLVAGLMGFLPGPPLVTHVAYGDAVLTPFSSRHLGERRDPLRRCCAHPVFVTPPR